MHASGWRDVVELNDRDPFASWSMVDVQFPADAGTDYVIRHDLHPQSPKDVHYRVVRQHTSGTVYEAPDSVWGLQYIVLRSDTPNWTGRLLLGTFAKPVPFDPTLVVTAASAFTPARYG